MSEILPQETIQGYSPPTVRQFSVFLENKVGKLLELVGLFDEATAVHLCAFSVLESSDHAVCQRKPLQRVTTVLLESLRFALAHREDALQYALRFGRSTPPPLADQFVSMYVNKWTLDFGDLGREAVRTFLRQLNEAGLVPDPRSIEFIDPG